MTKAEKIAKKLRDEYREAFDAAFLTKFGLVVTTGYNIFAMALVTEREDGRRLTKSQREWSKAYSDGYNTAMEMVRDYQ
jgi:hypothetical protein